MNEVHGHHFLTVVVVGGVLRRRRRGGTEEERGQGTQSVLQVTTHPQVEHEFVHAASQVGRNTVEKVDLKNVN